MSVFLMNVLLVVAYLLVWLTSYFIADRFFPNWKKAGRSFFWNIIINFLYTLIFYFVYRNTFDFASDNGFGWWLVLVIACVVHVFFNLIRLGMVKRNKEQLTA